MNPRILVRVRVRVRVLTEAKNSQPKLTNPRIQGSYPWV